MHNTFFEDTAYQLMGFHAENDNLFAVVEQPFVEVTSTTNLEQIKEFLLKNGFSNTRNNDYYNQELGLILEDLHDENVLTKDGLGKLDRVSPIYSSSDAYSYLLANFISLANA